MIQTIDASMLTRFASLEDPRDSRGKENLLLRYRHNCSVCGGK
jgi:hypothetical protein